MRRTLALASLAAAALMTLSGCNNTINGNAHILDGDTIELNGKRIRLYGIDAPELEQLCDGDPCGKKAKTALIEIIGGRSVACERVGIDRYGRTIGKCYVGNTDVGQAMVKSGWALAYKRYSLEYSGDEYAAKDKSIGIWGYRAFDEPWKYREANRFNAR